MIMVYADTLKHEDIPLVLFVGREPNDRREVGGWVGKYNFDGGKRKRRCAFWNTAYGLVAKTLDSGFTTKDVKAQSRIARSSVVAFADISPVSFLYSRHGKKKLREMVPKERFETHADQILNNSLMKRVRCIMISGSDRDGLKEQRESFESKAKDRGITCIRVPFLSGNTFPQVWNELVADQKALSAIRDSTIEWADKAGLTK